MNRTGHPRTWPPGIWMAVTLLVLVELPAAWWAVLWVRFAASTTCGEPAGQTQVLGGEAFLLVAAAAGLVPWLFGAFGSSLPGRTVLAGVVAVSPLLVAIVTGLRPSFWTGDFCF